VQIYLPSRSAQVLRGVNGGRASYRAEWIDWGLTELQVDPGRAALAPA